MSGSITFTGISGDTDFNSVIDALVDARRAARITPMENWKSEWEDKLEVISEIDSSLAAFYSTVRGMNSLEDILARTAGSSNSSVLTATADSTAKTGSHNIEVGPVWNYRKAVAIANDSDSDLGQGIIRIDATQLDSDFWDNIQSDYSDLRFYQGDEQLKFYIQNWDYGTQTADIWVQVPNIPSGGSEISMLYGNSEATASGEASLADLKSDWTEAAGVAGGLWRFDDSTADSSGNGNSGTLNGSAAYDASEVGWIETATDPPDFGKSLTLDGIDSFFQVDARFTIDETNNRIDFTEDLGDELSAVITEGTYTSSELETAVKTALETDGTATYTVTYDEATGKFTIAAAGISELGLLWSSGSNEGANARDILGYGEADNTGDISYTGDDATTTSLDSTDAFTASVWFKLDPADKATASLMDRYNDGDDNRKIFSLGLDASGQATFDMFDDLGSSYTITGSTDLADNQWHHIAVTVDNTSKEISLFVDGAQTGATETFTGEILKSGDPLGIGARIADGSASNLFAGSLDEAKWMGRAMEASEILSDYDLQMTEFDVDPADSEITVGEQTTLSGLAKSETEIHAGLSSTTAVVNNSGSDAVFAYQYGTGATVSLTVPDGTTLAELVSMINIDADNPGITASILNDGLGSSTSYHLLLAGDDTGKANTILIDNEATTLDGTGGTENFSSSTFEETQTAENAQLKINNYFIERDSNLIDDAVEGLTLSIGSVGSATVTIGTDNDAIVSKVQSFVESFNEVRAIIQSASRYDAESGEAGILLGNYVLQIVKARLDSIISSSAPGFDSDSDTYVTLQQMGFSTDAMEGSETQGLLLLDTAKLEEALYDDPDAVARVFSEVFGSSTSNTDFVVETQLTTMASTAQPGEYQVEVELTEGNENYGKGRFQFENGTWGDWTSLSGSSGNYYLSGTSGAEDGLVLNIKMASGDGNQIATVNLKNGVVFELGRELENLLDPLSGPLNTLDANYNDIIDNIETKIEGEERRMEIYSDMVRQRFARLDELMGRMTQQSSAFSSSVSSL